MTNDLVYNPIVIKQNLDDFMARKKAGEPTTILFDADNTLYRFSTYGQIHEALSRMYTRGFFKALPIFEEGPIVIETLQKMGVTCGIISTRIDSPYCVPEKLESFHYYFPMIPEEHIHIVEPGVLKASIVEDVYNTLLVDDYKGQIINWYNAGGVAVKKTYSGKIRPVPQVSSLIELFAICNDLGVFRR